MTGYWFRLTKNKHPTKILEETTSTTHGWATCKKTFNLVLWPLKEGDLLVVETYTPGKQVDPGKTEEVPKNWEICS